MLRVLGRQGRSLLVLLAVLAIAIAACSSSSKTTAPNATNGFRLGGEPSAKASTGGSQPSAVASTGGSQPSADASTGGSQPSADASTGNGGGTDLSGAAAKLSNINSYKFSMTIAGGDIGKSLSVLNPGASGNTPITIGGTIVVRPVKAADITLGTMRIIDTGGTQYIDPSGSGSFVSTPATSSIADSMAPATIFSSMIGPSTSSDFNKVGTEQKNGVSADHYQGTQAGLAQLGSATGVPGATWTADLWVATDGGYPVSMAIIGTMPDQSIGFEILFEIMNVNDPANTVTAPKV